MHKFLLLFLAVAVQSQSTKRRITEQPFFNYNDVFLGPIGLGNPTQLMFMALDPQSPAFFVVDSRSNSPGSVRKGFNTRASPTFQETGMPFLTFYNGNQQSGRIATEEFTALGLGKPAPRFPVPLVDRVSGPFANSKADGTMGWGLDSKPSMLRKLMSRLDQPVITVFLSAYKFVPTKGGITDQGQVTYGGDDLKHCQPNYQQIHVIPGNKWQVQANSVQFGNRQFRGGRAQFQPGLRRLYGPSSAILPMYWQIGARFDFALHEYVVDCASVNRLPVLTFNFNGGTSIRILPRDYTINAGNKCILAFGMLDPQVQQTDWLIGDVVSRSHCLQLNLDSRTVGIAPSRHFAS